MFWWVIVAVAGFLILRSILRSTAAPRHSGDAAPPAYGYGGFGGGGSFWSGLLGGLGGAWLGKDAVKSDDPGSRNDVGGGSGEGGGGW
jgi:hypothetical protein